MSDTNTSNKVLVQNARISFPHLVEPSVGDNGNKTYDCALLVEPDNAALAKIDAVVLRVLKENDPKHAETILENVKANGKYPWKNGKRKANYAGYAGHMYINARNKTRPVMYDGQRNVISDKEEIAAKFYSGAVVNAVVEIFYFNNKFGKGLGVGLSGLQFVRDGEHFAGGAPAAAEEFPIIEQEEADVQNPWD